MVFGLLDLDIDLAEVGSMVQENVYRAVEKAKSLFGLLTSYVYSTIKWVLERVWVIMRYAYQRAVDFFYRYIELAEKNPASFAKLSLSMLILFGG